MEVDSFGGGAPVSGHRPCIVIDAANVVYAAQSLAPDPRTPQPSLRTLIFAVDACKRAGLSTICVLPMGMPHLASNSSSPAEAEAITAWLSESQRTGELLLAPCQNKSDDDIFAIALAVRRDAFLLSNDRYGDHAFAIASAAGVHVTAVLSWIKERVITYGVAGGEVIPHPIKLAKAMRHVPGSAPQMTAETTHIIRPYLPSPATTSQAPSLGVNMSITIPAERIGAVIGRGGVTIKAIETSTGARIHIPRDDGGASGGESVIITITGMTEEAVLTAWHYVAAAATGTETRRIPATAAITTHIVRPYLPPQLPSQAPPLSVNMSITVPADRIGAVIGRGGMTIKAIETSTRARIQIPRDGGGSGAGEGVVISIVALTEDSASAAWHAIAAAATAASPPTERSQRVEQQTVSCSAVIDAHKLGIFFGRGGTALKALQESTGCRISVEPASENPTRTILVVGPAEGVQIAVTHIESLQVGSTRTSWGADL